MTETTTPKTIEEKVAELLEDQITHPPMPVDSYVIEVENLFNYASQDKDKLVANGLDASLIDELPPAIAFLQDKQSEWMQVLMEKVSLWKNGLLPRKMVTIYNENCNMCSNLPIAKMQKSLLK